MLDNLSEENDVLWCLSQESFPFENSIKESQVSQCLKNSFIDIIYIDIRESSLKSLNYIYQLSFTVPKEMMFHLTVVCMCNCS